MKRRERSNLKPRYVVLSITLCAAVCLAGIGYIWAKAQVYHLGQEIKTFETRLDEIKRENAQLRQSYASECNPRELDAAVRRLNLGLAAPRADQIVRLPEPILEQPQITTLAAAPVE